MTTSRDAYRRITTPETAIPRRDPAREIILTSPRSTPESVAVQRFEGTDADGDWPSLTLFHDIE